MDFHHTSVMPEEALAALAVKPDGVYVDCTLGGAGHARRIAGMLSPRGRLIGLDQDEAAIRTAKERLADASCRVDIVRSNFSALASVLEDLGVTAVDGVLFDLGVSSHQIDTPERGFSYMQDAPLDMRMDRTRSLSALEVVNAYEEAELCRIFKEYGEERWAKRIAAFIVEAREEKTIETTGELVDVICRAVPKGVRRAASGHPAKRIFQAIRIEVNAELEILRDAIESAVHALAPGGRIAVITFHSLEDRIVKTAFKALARGCVCPPGLPVCTCGHAPEIKILGKAKKPSAEEARENPRAKSAKLRSAEKLQGGSPSA